MKSFAPIAAALLLAGCATAQNEFSAAGVGQVDNAVDCAVDAISDEGFTVTGGDEAGFLEARNGAAWLQVHVVPADMGRYVVEVETSDSDVARDAAQEIVTECGT